MRMFRFFIYFFALTLVIAACRRQSLIKLNENQLGFKPGLYNLKITFAHDISGTTADFVEPGGFDSIAKRWFLFGDHPYRIQLHLFDQLGREVNERFAKHLRFKFSYEPEKSPSQIKKFAKFSSYTYDNLNTRQPLSDILWFEDHNRFFKTLFTLPEPFVSKDKYEISGNDKEERIPAKLNIKVYYNEELNSNEGGNNFPKGLDNSIFLCENTAHILVNSISDGYIKVEKWSVDRFSISISDLSEIIKRKNNIGIGKYYTDLPEFGPENEYPARFSIYLSGPANTRYERYKVRLLMQKQENLDEVPKEFSQILPGETVPKAIKEDLPLNSQQLPVEAMELLGTSLLNGQPTDKVTQGGDGRIRPSATIPITDFNSNSPLFKPSVSIPNPNGGMATTEIHSTDISMFFPNGVNDFKKFTGVYKVQFLAQRQRDNKQIRSKVYYLNFIDVLKSFRFRNSKEIWNGEKQEDPASLSGIVARKNHERYISSNSFVPDVDKKIYKDEEMYTLDIPKIPAIANGTTPVKHYPVKITFYATPEQPGDEKLIHLYGPNFNGTNETMIKYEWGKAYHCVAKDINKHTFYALSELYADIDKNGNGRQAKISVKAKIELDNPSPDDLPVELELGNITRVFVGTRLDGIFNTASYNKDAVFDDDQNTGHPQYWFNNGYSKDENKKGNLAGWIQKTIQFKIKKPGSDDHFKQIIATTEEKYAGVYKETGELNDDQNKNFAFDKDKIKNTIKKVDDEVTLEYNIKWKKDNSAVYVFSQKTTCNTVGTGLKSWEWNNGYDRIEMKFKLFEYGNRKLPTVKAQKLPIPTKVVEWDDNVANPQINFETQISDRAEQLSQKLFKCKETEGVVVSPNADDRRECAFFYPIQKKGACTASKLEKVIKDLMGDPDKYNNLINNVEIYDGPNKLVFTKKNNPSNANNYLGVYDKGKKPKDEKWNRNNSPNDNDALEAITAFFNKTGQRQRLKKP